MKSDFRDTPIGEVFEQVKHDLPLIQAEVESRQFESALRGMDAQIKSLTNLRDAMRKAFTGNYHPDQIPTAIRKEKV